MVDNGLVKASNETIDFQQLTYKDVKILSGFLSNQGKILPRRITGLSSKEQKKVTKLLNSPRSREFQL